MKLRKLKLPLQKPENANVRITMTGNAAQVTLVAYLVGQGKFPPIMIDPNGATQFKLPRGNYLFHIGFIRADGPCAVGGQVETRSGDSPFPDTPEQAGADAGKPGQLSIDVIV